jgi:hypothetical protein
LAKVLGTEEQIAITGSLREGSSIRSIERMTGVHRDTIMRLGVKVGQAYTAMMDANMRNLSCTRLETDEIWDWSERKKSALHRLTIPRRLHFPTVVSPQTAVPAAIVQEFKDRAQEN